MIETIGVILIAILSTVSAFLVGGRMGEHKGRKKEREDILSETAINDQKRLQAGREAVRDGRSKSPDERLRDNDGSW